MVLTRWSTAMKENVAIVTYVKLKKRRIASEAEASWNRCLCSSNKIDVI